MPPADLMPRRALRAWNPLPALGLGAGWSHGRLAAGAVWCAPARLALASPWAAEA